MRTLSLERRHLGELERLARRAGVTASIVLREILDGYFSKTRRTRGH